MFHTRAVIDFFRTTGFSLLLIVLKVDGQKKAGESAVRIKKKKSGGDREDRRRLPAVRLRPGPRGGTLPGS